MPIASNLTLAWAASRPTNDASTTGGALDATGTASGIGWRPLPAQLAANDLVRIVSTAGDTRTFTVKGRLPNGSPDTETIVANGTTPVNGAKTWERILEVSVATLGAFTAQLQRVTGATLLHTIASGEKGGAIMFQNAASAAGAVDREEKIFVHNSAADAANDCTVTLSGDTGGGGPDVIKIAIEAAKGGTASISDRLTQTFGLSFSDDGAALSVPTGFLGNAEAIGVIVQQALGAANIPVKDDFVITVGFTSIT